MSHAFVIAAHHDPAMFARLCAALHGAGPVFAHIDRKADEHPFRVGAPGVRFVEPRVDVVWGTFRMVEATLHLVRAALRDPRVERVTLLSGLSYPIVSSETLAGDWGDRDWIAALPGPDPARGKHAVRFERRYIGFADPESWQCRAVNGVVRRTTPRLDPVAALGDVPLSTGSQWWSLTRPTLERVLTVSDGGGPIPKYFRRTLLPDESYFHTLCRLHDPDMAFGPETTFVKWAGGPHPAALTASDLVTEVAGRRFSFVRKLGSAQLDLLELADALRATNTGPMPRS